MSSLDLLASLLKWIGVAALLAKNAPIQTPLGFVLYDDDTRMECKLD